MKRAGYHIVASVYVTKATPDGHTLFLTSSTTHGVAPVLYKKLRHRNVKGRKDGDSGIA